MTPLPLVNYQTSLEYRKHYEQYYCRKVIYTFDGIRVYFKPTRFDFVTAYLANNSIHKIQKGPRWSREEFEK